APGQAVTLWHSPGDSYPAGTRFDGGNPAPDDLAFRTYSRFDLARPWLVPLACPQPALCPTDTAIYVNQQTLPRAWLVHQVEVQPDSAAQVPRLYDPAFDWTRTALLA